MRDVGDLQAEELVRSQIWELLQVGGNCRECCQKNYFEIADCCLVREMRFATAGTS